MKKVWVRYWKKSGANMWLTETWVLHSKDDKEEDIKPSVEDWAETVGGGFSRGYKYGYECDCPPTKEWIERKIKRIEHTKETLNAEIKELSK